MKKFLFAFLLFFPFFTQTHLLFSQSAGSLDQGSAGSDPVLSVPVTFRLSMRGQSIVTTPWISGSFNGWTLESMTFIEDNVFEITKNLPAGEVFYKFGHGPDYEVVPASCGVGPDLNRRIVVGTSPLVVPLVCINRCDDGCIPKRLVKFSVNMAGQSVSPEGVFVAGQFNFWNYVQHPLTAMGNNIYEGTFLIPTAPQQYKFVNGSTYEQVPSACGTGSNLNRIINSTTTDEAPNTVCFGDCDQSCQSTSLLTLRVDMTGQNVTGAVLIEPENGGSNIPMALIGNNIYSATFPVPENLTYYDFRFRNGSSSETIIGSCAMGGFPGYRSINIPFAIEDPPTFCYGRCNWNCGLTTYPITFRVSMKGQNVGIDGVKLAGSFNGFSTTVHKMKYVGNSIYEITLPLSSNTYTYKFVNGSTFENGLTGCGVGGTLNRQVVVNGASQVLPLVCFGQCSNTCDPTNYSKVTFRLSTQGSVSDFVGPRLTGSFNGFSVTDMPMERITQFLFEASYMLPVGQTFLYKFTRGSTYEAGQSGSPCFVNDGTGNLNRSLVVPASDTRLPTVCYNRCNSSCVIPATVIFRVNMSGQTVSPQGIKLAGSFNGFSTTATPMTPIGNNIYTVQLDLEPDLYTYKFVNGTTFEDGLFDCGTGTSRDRKLLVNFTFLNLNPVCFGRCDNVCSSSVPTYPVTFRVNMTGQTVSPQGIKLAGSFNGFSTTANPMTALGNNLYETTLQLQNGTYSYKFVNGSTFEEGLTTCGVGPSLDRQIVVNNSALSPATVCFGRCDNVCSSSVPTYPVTFRVNMTGQTVSPQGVKLSGSFNGFSTTSNPMTLVGSNEYEATVSLQSGSYVYKFVNGSTFEEGLSNCGTGPTLDRQLNVTNVPQTLSSVCFGLCDASCLAVGIQYPEAVSGLQLYPNPAGDWAKVTGLKPLENLKVLSTTGKVVWESQAYDRTSEIQIPCGRLASGLYWLVGKDRRILFSVQH